MYNLRKVVGEPYITCKCWKLFVNSLQVRQLSMKLNNLLAHYAQFDDLLTAATEKLDVTEYSLDKYSTSGTIDIIATHISSIQVCTVPPNPPFGGWNVTIYTCLAYFALLLSARNGIIPAVQSPMFFIGYFWEFCLTTNYPFNGLFSRTTWVSQYQKGKTSLDLNEARDDGVWGCSGISWTIYKQSAPHFRRITTPTPHHSIFTGLLFLMPNQHC